MAVWIVDTGDGISANSELVVDALVETRDVNVLSLDVTDPSRRVRKRVEREVGRFAHTPEPLLDSWRIAQYIASATDPGDVVVISDRGGIGGVFALMEASKRPEERRVVWTVAGDGILLESLLIAGTVDDADVRTSSEVDWELVQYHNSAEVLATSHAAVDLLASFGIVSDVCVVRSAPPDRSDDPSGEGAWIPGPVSRRNRSGDILRAAASSGAVTVAVSTEDSPDLIWSGTTWEALTAIRTVLGERLSRAERPITRPAFVIVGDALAPPDGPTTAWRNDGVSILADRGSVAASMWPEVDTWETSDDLSSLLQGATPPESEQTPVLHLPSDAGALAEWRAQRISVGVPVFQDVRYLDECVESILNQTHAPTEIVLMDDGSDSTVVDEALVGWARREPDLVRILRQPNRGVCVARNRMIDAMSGDAYLLVDQDDVLEPEFLRRTGEAMRQDDSLWAVAVWTEFFGEYEGIEAKPPFDRRVGLRENPIVSTAALVDMQVRDEGIMFEPDLAFLHCEDWNFWSQIIAAGGRMGLVPQPLIKHRVHHASGGFQRTEVAHRIGKARATEPLRR